MPRVSVIIPAYNHAAFVAEAVRSVLTQTEPDLELIVVDDGSTDETLTVLRGFDDARLRILEQNNQGAHAAINRGLASAAGAYLAILNSDDAYHPQRLQKLIATLEAAPSVGLIGSYIEVVDSRGESQGIKCGYHNLEPWLLEDPTRSFRAGDDLRAGLLTENYLATTSNFVFSRALYESVGSFRGLRYTHDWDFALRVARTSQLALAPEPLLRYRIHAGNTIRENQAAMFYEICWCMAVHLPQHIADDTWFGKLPSCQRVDQLLHSIYTNGCDRILSVMLLQGLAYDHEKAMQLLNPDNRDRAVYLEFIERQLMHGALAHTPIHLYDRLRELLPASLRSRLRGWWSRMNRPAMLNQHGFHRKEEPRDAST